MERVNGIGGVFLYANYAAKLAAWYGEVLGIDTVANEERGNYYAQFEQRDLQNPEREVGTVFAIFKASATLPEIRGECMVNLRVSNLAAMIQQLRTNGIEIGKYEEYDYGLFAWIKDPEGYSIELFEPR
jgi:predicted enzyme related to lactoylglutathione lyase